MTAAQIPLCRSRHDDLGPGSLAGCVHRTAHAVSRRGRGRVVRHAVRDLPLRLRLPDGTVLGAGGPQDPVMTVHRPGPSIGGSERAG